MTREEAIMAVKEVTGMSLPWNDRHYEALQMAIKALEEPERKPGHWILHPEQEKNIFGVKTIECSECGDKCLVQFVGKEKYCRNCGADMRGTEK